MDAEGGGLPGIESYNYQWSQAHPTAGYQNEATGGDAYAAFVAEEATCIGHRIAGQINIYSLRWGANDSTSDTAPSLAALPLHVARMKAAGFSILLVTLNPKADNAFNTWRATLRTLQLSMLSQGLVDGIADFGADQTYCKNADGFDTAMYSDGLHPNNTIHTYLQANYYAPAIAAITKPRYVVSW